MDLTVEQLGQEFRNHFEELKKNYGLMYTVNFPYRPTYPNGVYMTVSNLGAQNVDDRLDDMFMQATNEGPGMETFLYYLSYSKVMKDSNTYISRLRFPRESITAKKAQILSDSINHLLKDVPIDTKLGEVVAELRDFQNKLDKVY